MNSIHLNYNSIYSPGIAAPDNKFVAAYGQILNNYSFFMPVFWNIFRNTGVNG